MISRGRRRFWILLVLVGVYAVLGYFVLPPIARTELQKRMAAQLGRTVSIGAVKIDPFAFSIALERVQIMNASGAEPFAGWRRLSVNFDPLASLRGEWVLGEITLEDFRGGVEIDEHGTPSFSDLLDRFGKTREPDAARPAEPRQRSRPWRISRLTVAGAQVDFVDRSRSEVFRTLLGPVNFTLVEFRTAGGHGAPYRFEARSESGEKLTWTGSLSARPLTSTGEWRLENVLLSKYAPYLDEQMNLLLTAGKLTLSGRYDVSFLPDDRRLQVTEGAAQLTNLKLVERATGQPLLELPTAELRGFSVDGLQRRVALGTLRLSGGRLAVRRDADGALNLASVLAPRSAGSSAGDATEPAHDQPIEVTATEFGVRDFVVQWHDGTTPRPVDIELTGVNATVKDVTSTRGATLPVEATFGLNPQGTARASGNVALAPFRLNLDLELAWMPLPPFSGYMERALPVRLARGTASLKGRVAVAPGPAGPDVSFTGGGRLEEVVFASALREEELGGFANLAANDVTVSSHPRVSVTMGAVNVSAPYTRLAVDQNGQLNFAQLTGAREPGAAVVAMPRAKPAPGTAPLDLTVGQLTIDGGELTFSDNSLQPAVEMVISQIGGSVQNVSSRNPARGEADLRAFVGGEGPVVVRGRFNPFAASPFADLAVEAKSIDLSPVSPYVAKYAGYELERGALFLETQAKLVEQRLDIRNKVTLEQFTLGRPTPSPDAVKLPVRLGVALLKDANGRIVLDVPVQGSLADPQFQVGRVVGQVLTGVLAKAATSPFSLIGSMFGGGGEELQYQDFAPGEATPTAASLKRLAVLQRAMAERPELRLRLEPSYDPGELYELKRRTLEEQIRRRVWEKLRAADATVPPIEELLISSSNRADAITQMFDERFGRPRAVRPEPVVPPPVGATAISPPEASAAAARTAPVVDEPAPAEPVADGTPAFPETQAAPAEAQREQHEKPGLIRRAWNMATLKGLRDRWWGEDEKPVPVARRPEPPPAPVVQPPQPQVAQTPPPAPVQAPPAAPSPAPLDVPLSEMEQRLIDTLDVGAKDLTQLAEARAERVKELLTKEGRVAPDRVQIAKIKDDASVAKGPRVTLHLD
ncbi:DUF748 domain-containing protein [Opitutus terrae]|uniref:DUF748 domain-containing protein n=1 Tax=Opitutus terrae (strain DSM 11246 / JCM 15787 / PB90-1) TaxID=452637 RepID=B1ZQ83_OPITP|nr:DUF748 domain-containing protein [Opitutus terrae]ACB73563.1 protein of unknown function DUF748 [Opitutus terrae PB90-1]